MMVIYLPVKFEFDWTKPFLESRNENVDGQTNGQTKRRNYIFELESGNKDDDGQTNGQKMDKRTDRITPISKGT